MPNRMRQGGRDGACGPARSCQVKARSRPPSDVNVDTGGLSPIFDGVLRDGGCGAGPSVLA